MFSTLFLINGTAQSAHQQWRDINIILEEKLDIELSASSSEKTLSPIKVKVWVI